MIVVKQVGDLRRLQLMWYIQLLYFFHYFQLLYFYNVKLRLTFLRNTIHILLHFA